MASLFRIGAANAGASESLSVRIISKGQEHEITKNDVLFALSSVTGDTKIRKLAESLAPEIIAASITQLMRGEKADLKGDLANKINRILASRKETPLTAKEEISAATYAQWIPNLDEITGSTRLKKLLEDSSKSRKPKPDNNKKQKRQN